MITGGHYHPHSDAIASWIVFSCVGLWVCGCMYVCRCNYSLQRIRGVSHNVLYKCTIFTYLLTNGLRYHHEIFVRARCDQKLGQVKNGCIAVHCCAI